MNTKAITFNRRRILTAGLALAGVFLATCGLTLTAHAADGLKIATLHPLISDLARNVGGDRVSVLSLVEPGDDPHQFQPAPSDLVALKDVKLILASGKGMEPYLEKLQDNLHAGQKLVEVGRKVPSIKIEAGSELFVCCPAHSAGSIDPHWWHSIANMQRAARIVADELGEADPANKAAYEANAKNYSARLGSLEKWAKGQISQIPRGDRKLVTAHAAFGYFCKEFGFRSIPVQGLNRERDSSPKYLAETIEILKAQQVKAIFPETLANPKVLQEMVRETGVGLGDSLIADGSAKGEAGTYEGMMRHNVAAVVRGLSGT